MGCCSNHHHGDKGSRSRFPLFWIALIGLAGVLVYLKWDSVAGFSPLLLLFLACPLMHLFMHKKHGGKCDQTQKTDQTPHDTSK